MEPVPDHTIKLELAKITTSALKMWLAQYKDFVRQVEAELERRRNPELVLPE
jgi:hypothetical protein